MFLSFKVICMCNELFFLSFISVNNKNSLITVGTFAATSVINHGELMMEVSNL